MLAAQQIVTRALGIWGLLLMAEALGLAFAPALLVAAICSLGALIAGPSVLTFEYEPTPRAFAVPLLFCAVGLAAHRRYLAAGVAAAAAFLYHPPTALPFWGVYLVLALWPHGERRARLAGLVPLAVAAALLWVAARTQSASGEAQRVFARLDAGQEFLQRMRTAYVWISAWPAATIVHHLLVLCDFRRGIRARPPGWRRGIAHSAAGAGGARTYSPCRFPGCCWSSSIGVWYRRCSRCACFCFSRSACSSSLPPPGAVAIAARRPAEAFAWFAFAYLLPLQPVLTGPFVWSRVDARHRAGRGYRLRGARRNSLGARGRRRRLLRDPDRWAAWSTTRGCTRPSLRSFSAWARANTRRDAVFVFPGVNRGLAPGIFRSEALRAVYVDWKGGGQVNYLKDLGEQWWFRWRQTRNFKPADLPQYGASGISYVVLQEPLPAGGAIPEFHLRRLQVEVGSFGHLW